MVRNHTGVSVPFRCTCKVVPFRCLAWTGSVRSFAAAPSCAGSSWRNVARCSSSRRAPARGEKSAVDHQPKHRPRRCDHASLSTGAKPWSLGGCLFRPKQARGSRRHINLYRCRKHRTTLPHRTPRQGGSRSRCSCDARRSSDSNHFSVPQSTAPEQAFSSAPRYVRHFSTYPFPSLFSR